MIRKIIEEKNLTQNGFVLPTDLVWFWNDLPCVCFVWSAHEQPLLKHRPFT